MWNRNIREQRKTPHPVDKFFQQEDEGIRPPNKSEIRELFRAVQSKWGRDGSHFLRATEFLLERGADPNDIPPRDVKTMALLLRRGADPVEMVRRVRDKEILVGNALLAAVLDDVGKNCGLCDVGVFRRELALFAEREKINGTNPFALETKLAERVVPSPSFVSPEAFAERLRNGEKLDRRDIPGLIFLFETEEALHRNPGMCDMEKFLFFCKGCLEEQFALGTPLEAGGRSFLLDMSKNISEKLDEIYERRLNESGARRAATEAAGNAFRERVVSYTIPDVFEKTPETEEVSFGPFGL